MTRLLWFLPVTLSLVGLSSLSLTLDPAPSPASATAPGISKSHKTISALGELRLRGKATIVTPPPNIARTLIKPGDRVEAGQVIFLLANYQPTMAKLQDNPSPANWQALSHQLNHTKVKAPVTGQVIRVSPIVEIANPQDFQIIAHIPSDKVKPGQTAVILCDRTEILGKVTDIQPDHSQITLQDPALALQLLDQPFKVKFIDNAHVAYYN